eukprot:g845.t1
MSAQPGGDDIASVVDADIGSMFDIGKNPLAFNGGISVTEIPDTIPPTLVSAVVDLGLYTLIFEMSETIDVTPASNVDSSKVSVLNASASLALNGSRLVGAYASGADSFHVTLHLTESQRTNILYKSKTPGGDYSGTVMKLFPSCIHDVAQVKNSIIEFVNLTEIADSVPPSLYSASIALSHGYLTIRATETLDLSPFTVAKFNISKFYLSESIGSQNVSLHGSTVIANGYDMEYVVVELTEEQRVAAILMSGTPGGDGDAVFVESEIASFTDIGQLKNVNASTVIVNETLDSVAPSITNATLKFGLGTLVLTASETLLLSSQQHVNFSKIVIRNDDSDPGIRLTGASVNEYNALKATINLLETQRIPLLYVSGVPGGDGTAVRIDFEHGAFLDVGLNPSNLVENFTAFEEPDNIPPKIESGSINYTDGVLRIKADEYIDSTPISLVNLSLIDLADISQDRAVRLNGAGIVSKDGEVLTLILTELQRAKAIALSAVQGGNGGATILDTFPGSLTDITGGNRISSLTATSLTEVADSRRPTLGSGEIDYNNGKLTLNASETLDVDNAPTASGFNLSTIAQYADVVDPFVRTITLNMTNGKMVLNISEIVDVGSLNVSLVAFMNKTTGSHEVILSGADVMPGDSYLATIMLTESQRVKAIEASATPGGDGEGIFSTVYNGAFQDYGENFVNLNANLAVEEIPDIENPRLLTANINYGIAISATPGGDAGAAVMDFDTGALQDIGTNSLSEILGVTQQDSTIISVILTELQRASAIQISGTSGGDSVAALIHVLSGAFTDIGLVDNPFASLVLEESPDIVRPVPQKLRLNFTDGIVELDASETIDISPSSNFDGSKVEIRGTNGGAPGVKFSAATISGSDDTTITFQISEQERVDAIRFSAEPGGSNVPKIKLYGSGLRDVAENFNIEVDNVQLVTFADILAPRVVNVSVDYNNGEVLLQGSETLLAGLTNLSIIDIHDDGMRFSLSGNPVMPDQGVANAPVTVFLSEVQRVAAIANSGTPGGDTTAVLASVSEGGLFDIGLNPNKPHINLTVRATVEAGNNNTLALVLTETQRVRCIQASGTPGGDGTALKLTVLEHAVSDLSNNLNINSSNVFVKEINDTRVPTIDRVILDLDSGVLSLFCSETIDITPATRVHINDISLVDSATGSDVVLFSLANSNLLSTSDATSVNITLGPFERVAAIANSSFLDGTPLKLHANAVLSDIALNYNLNSQILAIEELEDVTPIVTLHADLDYNDGLLAIHFSEPVDITPLALINLTLIKLVNRSGDANIVLQNCIKESIIDHFNFTLRLAELDRVELIVLSGTQGGDGSAVVLDVLAGAVRDIATNLNEANLNIVVNETADTTRPQLVSGLIDYNDGMLTLNFSETVDTTPRNFVDLSKFVLVDNSPAGNSHGNAGTFVPLANSLTISNDTQTLLQIRLSEAERVTALSFSATPGGVHTAGTATKIDLEVGACRDVATNLNVETVNLALEEVSDTTRPSALVASVRLTDGVLVFENTETLRFSTLNFSAAFFSNSSSIAEFTLLGATVVQDNLPSITVLLKEAMRARAVEISATSGGDGLAAVLNLEDSAIKDMAGNDIFVAALTLSESPDVGEPILISATVALTTGVVTMTFNETIDMTPITLTNFGKMFITNDAYGGDILIQGAKEFADDSVTISVVLTEAQRVLAIVRSETPGGDGVAAHLHTEASACVDLAGNNNSAFDVVLIEHADTGTPFLFNATVDYNNGEIIMFFNETIMASPASMVNTTKLVVVNATNSQLVLYGSVATVENKTFVNVTMTEQQRVIAIAMSGTAGGDGAPISLTMNPFAVYDMAFNPNVLQTGVFVTETGDTTDPLVTNATLDFSGGTLTITSNEFFDTTPKSLVNLSRIIVVNQTGDGSLPLNGADVLSDDGFKLVLKLTELQRVTALRIADVKGGDGTQLKVDILRGAFFDVAGNSNVPELNRGILEIEDVINPTIDSASFNYSDGMLVIHTSETIDTTPKSNVVLEKIWLAQRTSLNATFNAAYDNYTYTTLSNPERVSLVGAEVVENDRTSVTIMLTIHQRAQLQYWASTPGGDGQAVVLDNLPGSFHDMSYLPVIGKVNLTVIEFADIVPPEITSVVIDIGTGVTVITFDEHVKASSLNMTQLIIAQSAGALSEHAYRLGNMALLSPDGNVINFQMTEQDRVAAFYMSSDYDNFSQILHVETGAVRSEERTTNITLPESLRANLVQYTATPGGDGVPLTLDVLENGMQDMGLNPNIAALNLSMVEIGDITPPVVTGAELKLSEGVLILNMSETIDAEVGGRLTQFNYPGVPYPINLAKIFISNSADNNDVGVSLVGAAIGNISSTTLTFNLTEVQRAALIVISGTSGGDGSPTVLNLQADGTPLVLDVGEGAFKDLAENNLIAVNGLPVIETSDVIKPALSSAATINYADGTMRVAMTETLDRTPIEFTDLDKMFLGNVSNDSAVPLSGASIVAVDTTLFTITLTELQRVNAIAMSATPGGDGSPLIFDMLAKAVVDLSSNLNDDSFNNTLVETRDYILPFLESGSINFSDGRLILKASETIDLTPKTNVNLPDARFVDNHDGSGTSAAMNSATFDEVDSTVVTLTLSEEERVNAYRISSRVGGDGTNVFFKSISGAINYTTGTMVIEFSETLGVGGGLIDLSKAFLANYEPVIYEFVGLAFRRFESDPAQSGFNAFVLDWDANEMEDYADTTTYPSCSVCSASYSGMQVELTGMRYVRNLRLRDRGQRQLNFRGSQEAMG